MVFYRIVLRRSLIGVPKSTKSIVKSLGLGKRGSVIYRKATPACAGSLAKIKELISVEVTENELSKMEQREIRKSNPGFTVHKRAPI